MPSHTRARAVAIARDANAAMDASTRARAATPRRAAGRARAATPRRRASGRATARGDAEATARTREDGDAGDARFSFRRHEACVRTTLRARCGEGLEEARVDDAFAARANAKRGVTTTTEAWSSRRLRRVRSTYVDGGEKAQIYNCAVYPACEACDAPVFGVDLICVGVGAARKILIGVDLQPMSRDRDYNDAYVPKLLKLRDGGALSACAEALNATTPSKKFYEDATYFSRGMFFARPALANEETMARSLDVVRAYLDVWLDRLDEAEREAEAMDGACKFVLSLEDVRRCVLTEASAREAQDAHDAWQLEHDPAIAMFASWYGEEWARDFAETVLFPGARG